MGNKVMRLRIFPDKIVFHKGEMAMNEKQAQVLGALLRAKRKELGYSTYKLAEAAGVSNSTVVRFELGRFAAPSPEKLAKFAEALGLNLSDVYTKAGYVVPSDLPNFEIYLGSKYPELSKAAIKHLKTELEELQTE
jgi:transcriptional regulator with XRE-family HTH domain